LFGPRVRIPDDPTRRSYAIDLTMTIRDLLVLAALDRRRLHSILSWLPHDGRRGRPWSCSRAMRVLVTCAALRTNLTVRELAAVAGISKSTVHRIVADITPRLARLLRTPLPDRRWSWVIDGTLIPTRAHTAAARSKNYRYSCNAQVRIRRRDRRVIAIAAGGPGNRNDTVHYRGSALEALCRQHGRVLADGGYRGISELVTPRFRGRTILRDRAWRIHRRHRARVEHVLARFKDWRILRDHRRRGHHVPDTVAAVAALHNLRLELRDSS
jgi:hypothetical protein